MTKHWQHRVAGHVWVRGEQEKKKNEASKFLLTGEPALAVHQAIDNFTEIDGVPEAIMAAGRATIWKKQPEQWEETMTSKIKMANDQVMMAEQFLAATEHILCAFYSLVSCRM